PKINLDIAREAVFSRSCINDPGEKKMQKDA
ncbi:MAG: hypothetical protein UU14_C0040G0014, partial [Candidatus Roizmanbacteria bacterium GW2011_GWB1_40_7]